MSRDSLTNAWREEAMLYASIGAKYMRKQPQPTDAGSILPEKPQSDYEALVNRLGEIHQKEDKPRYGVYYCCECNNRVYPCPTIYAVDTIGCKNG